MEHTLIIKYKNTNLDIYIKNEKIDYNINEDIALDLLRDNFNESIANLSIKHNSLEYWLMRLSERNTLIHSLFLDICKVKLLESFNKSNLTIFTNNLSIYLYFKHIADISFSDMLLFKSKIFSSNFKPYLHVIRFLLKKILFQVKYADISYKKNLNTFTIIQTWVSDNNFKINDFKDSYYGNLAQYLKENGKKVITWPIFYNLKDEKRAIAYLRKNQNNFLVIEDYLKFADYIEAVKHFFVKRFLKLGNIRIDNSDFTSVFKYYQKKETIEMVSLFYSFTRRLKENNNENITFIHQHENMIPEKALILGVKRYLPNSKVIGYFHTTKPKNILCLDYANNKEYKVAPKPDAIIFNCNKYKKYYQEKYSHLPMHNGIAFKQKYLKDNNQTLNESSRLILVLFSGRNGEIELMFSLLNKISTDYKFLFRMHPMNQFNVKKYYTKDNYIIVNNESLDESLSKVNKVISTYSAVALESALKGFIIGLVYNKEDLLLNPFDFTNIDNYSLISNFSELNKFLKEEFTIYNVEQIFNIDEEFYKIFLEVT